MVVILNLHAIKSVWLGRRTQSLVISLNEDCTVEVKLRFLLRGKGGFQISLEVVVGDAGYRVFFTIVYLFGIWWSSRPSLSALLASSNSGAITKKNK